jgi:N6-adenosine-specific RNA methylase IME4
MKKYNVIYADPPWQYTNKHQMFEVGETYDRGIENQYQVMNSKDLKGMPIKSITQDDCVCFIWATNPLLPEALELLKAWGFKYKTMLTWKKTTGSGYWFMGYTEHLLFGVKGNIKAFRSGISNFLDIKSGEHSEKPHQFRELIFKVSEESFDKPERLELFARSRVGLFPDYEYKGWDVYGDEVSNSIKLLIKYHKIPEL